MKILHRQSGDALYEDSAPTMRKTVEAAVRAGADLRDANLGSADLRGADLRGANLRGADLGGADLRGANLGSANLRGADLGGANLRGADLGGADLRGAYLRGAYLRGATMIDAGQDSRSYRFVAIRQDDIPYRVSAGCRWCTPEESLAHWAEAHADDLAQREECLAKVALIERVARARGWIA